MSASTVPDEASETSDDDATANVGEQGGAPPQASADTVASLPAETFNPLEATPFAPGFQLLAAAGLAVILVGQGVRRRGFRIEPLDP